jgi:hypothetical protein
MSSIEKPSGAVKKKVTWDTNLERVQEIPYNLDEQLLGKIVIKYSERLGQNKLYIFYYKNLHDRQMDINGQQLPYNKVDKDILRKYDHFLAQRFVRNLRNSNDPFFGRVKVGPDGKYTVEYFANQQQRDDPRNNQGLPNPTVNISSSLKKAYEEKLIKAYKRMSAFGKKKKKVLKGKPKLSAIQAVRNDTRRLKGTDGKWYCILKKKHFGSRPKWVLCSYFSKR